MILASPSNGIYTRPCVVSNSVVQQRFSFFLVPCYLQYIVQRRRSTIQRCNHCVTEIDFYYSIKLPNNVIIITIVYLLLLLLSLLHRKKCSTIMKLFKNILSMTEKFLIEKSNGKLLSNCNRNFPGCIPIQNL